MRKHWAAALIGISAGLMSNAAVGVSFESFAIEAGTFRAAEVLRLSQDGRSTLVLVGEDEDAERRFAIHVLDRAGWRNVHEAGLPQDALFVDILATGDTDQLVVFDGRQLFRLGPPEWDAEPLAIDPLPTIYRGETSGVAIVDVARDVNGDGRDDIVLPNFDGLWIVLQDESDGFVEPVKIPVAPTMDSSLSVTYVVAPVYPFDFDGDGRGDLGVHHDSRFKVFKDAMVETADAMLPTSLSGDDEGPVRVLDDVGDFNGDGVADLSVSTTDTEEDLFAASSATEFYFGEHRDGRLSFRDEADAILQTGAFGDVEMTDVNGDGLMDAVVVAGSFSVRKLISALVTRSMTVEIQIYYMGAEGFAGEPDVTRKIKVSEDRSPFGFGDVNGDGLTDFVQRTDDGLAVYLGERTDARLAKRAEEFDLKLPFEGRNPSRVEAVDLDGDGRDDFLLRYGNQEYGGVGVVMSR
ncbi:MAG: VCBS repeat-containing protein [Gammaproteobacteria bacterium]|nr:VCBS repeat-containing protein [Gammaproteobacteria bacterium]